MMQLRWPVYSHQNQARIAAQILVFCCACWALSFPITKALEMLGRREVPGSSTIFFAALCVTLRFLVSAAVLGIVVGSRWKALTKLEIQQGLGLGFFGGLGLILQMDGLAYTLASTSAFLTQGYCLWLPVWFALRHRHLPPLAVLGACGLVLIGGAILARVEWGSLRLGRGEWETLAGSVFFAGQILWLERPQFSGNHVGRFSCVMFATMALTSLPVAWISARQPQDLLTSYANSAAVVLLALLVIVCTLVSFVLANRWQPKLPAIQAGLVYATEPIFTAAIAVCVPGIISRATGINYPNEQVTWNLLVGGGMILSANLWMLRLGPGTALPDRPDSPDSNQHNS